MLQALNLYLLRSSFVLILHQYHALLSYPLFSLLLAMSSHASQDAARGEYSLQSQHGQSEWELECIDAVYRASASYDTGAWSDYGVDISDASVGR